MYEQFLDLREPDPVRILHVNAGNLYGGIETLLVTLARQRALCAEMEPEFAVCFEGRLSEELRAAGVRVHMLGAARVSRPWTIWRARLRLRALLADGGPDVVVTHGCWPHAIAAPAARRARLPLLFWMHNFQAAVHWLDRCGRGVIVPITCSPTVGRPWRPPRSSFPT